MALDINKHLGVHATALQLRQKRGELLAANLANADTPGYLARDLDFGQALAAAGRGGATAGGDAAFLRYRVPLAPALDGNTVDPQLEQAAFAENAVRYQATLSFLNSKFRSLMTAITGQ
ncbi:MAG: flagellar basal body rod protein FlgB [Pseudomonadota bacterium]